MSPSSTLDPAAVKILEVMAAGDGPWSNKDIAGQAGLEAGDVSKIVGKLKKAGLVDSPVRCKYAITPEGLNQVN